MEFSQPIGFGGRIRSLFLGGGIADENSDREAGDSQVVNPTRWVGYRVLRSDVGFPTLFAALTTREPDLRF